MEDIQRLGFEAKLCDFLQYILPGESSFTHPEIGEIINLIKRNQDIDFIINTNAAVDSLPLYLIDLKKCKNLTLQIGYDGLSTETFDTFRGCGVKKKVDKIYPY